MKIKDKYDLGELGRRITAARRSSGSEGIAFDAFEIENIESVLGTCIEFGAEIPETDKRGLITEAVTTAAQETEINAADLEKNLRRVEGAYLSIRPRSFVLATSITVGHFDELKRTQIDRTTISFSRSLPPKFRRKQVEGLLDRAIGIDRPDKLTTVRVAVTARTHAAAFEQAKEKLDLLRGIWNYWNNRRALMRRVIIGASKPVNAILPGPVYTLHDPGGALAVDSVWGEPKHLQFSDIFNLRAQWESVRRFQDKTRDSLKEIPYNREIKQLIVRYVRALDENDYEVVYNKLWGVFEHLAGAVGNYKPLINRASFLYNEADRTYMRLLLEHLRDVRNRLVHHDEQSAEMMTYVFQLKMFTESLFRFHLSLGKDFGSLATAGEFLDLPSSPQELRRKIDLYRKALRFQTG